MARRWLRYGLVGNTIFFGGGFAAMGYILWVIYDLGNNSVKMDEELAKELFSRSQIKPNILATTQSKLKEQNKITTLSKNEYI